GHSQLFRMRIDGSGIEQLTHDDRVNWFPHPSPDGRELVYLSYAPGIVGHPANQRVELRALSEAGRRSRVRRPLLGGQGTVNVNCWSPDGRRFAYVESPMASAERITRNEDDR